jgi:hypothetical protein
MKRDYKKWMDQKAKMKRRSKKYLFVGSSLAAGMLFGLAPSFHRYAVVYGRVAQSICGCH